MYKQSESFGDGQLLTTGAKPGWSSDMPLPDWGSFYGKAPSQVGQQGTTMEACTGF